MSPDVPWLGLKRAPLVLIGLKARKVGKTDADKTVAIVS